MGLHRRPQPDDRAREAAPPEAAAGFDGLPAEYTQFDFGECEVEFTATGTERVQFFVARLKYSRFMHLVLVPDQTAETLVRSLIACRVVFGGSTKERVFDNPRTVRISPIGAKPVVLHRLLRQLVVEYNVIATLCAPRSGNQKGSVERVVGYVKNCFLRVRKFRDLADLEARLGDWLHDVNHVCPSDATGVIPAVARDEEARWIAERPVQVGPEAWAIEDSATVTPMGTISYLGTAYPATGRQTGGRGPPTPRDRPPTVRATLFLVSRTVCDARRWKCRQGRRRTSCCSTRPPARGLGAAPRRPRSDGTNSKNAKRRTPTPTPTRTPTRIRTPTPTRPTSAPTRTRGSSCCGTRAALRSRMVPSRTATSGTTPVRGPGAGPRGGPGGSARTSEAGSRRGGLPTGARNVRGRSPSGWKARRWGATGLCEDLGLEAGTWDGFEGGWGFAESYTLVYGDNSYLLDTVVFYYFVDPGRWYLLSYNYGPYGYNTGGAEEMTFRKFASYYYYYD